LTERPAAPAIDQAANLLGALSLMVADRMVDAMAELQDASGLRFIPMTLMPAWDVDRCVQETNLILKRLF